MASAVKGTVTVRQGLGSGRFGPSRTYAVGPDPIAIAVGDVNGDGRPDIIIADQASGAVSVLLNQGNGLIRRRTDLHRRSDALVLAIGDINGDGKLDIVTANHDGNDVSVLLGKGDGTFGVARRPSRPDRGPSPSRSQT